MSLRVCFFYPTIGECIKHSVHIVICKFMQNNSLRRNDKGRAKTFFNKYILPLNLFARFERVVWGSTMRGSWRSNRNCNILTPHSYARQRCVFLVLQGCSTGRPRGPTLGGDLLHLISNFSAPQLNQGPRDPSALVWLSLPHLVL